MTQAQVGVLQGTVTGVKAGVVLPLLPATPFVLLSAYCFARSSPRLHGWLLAHKLFGPLIRNWEQHRAISPRAKLLATLQLTARGVPFIYYGECVGMTNLDIPPAAIATTPVAIPGP